MALLLTLILSVLLFAVYSNPVEVSTDTASSLIAASDSQELPPKRNVHKIKPIDFELTTSIDATEIESSNDIIEAMRGPTASPSFRSRSLCPSKSHSPILYHSNSPVMLGNVPIYLIWYGEWTMDQHNIVADFFNNLSNSDWLNIQTTYYQKDSNKSSPKYVSSSVKLAKEAQDLYSQGTYIMDDNSLQLIISKQLDSQFFPVDTNALYFVLTGQYVAVNGFCSDFCGYHTSYTYSNGKKIKYAFVGNASRCLNSCSTQSVGPNGDAGVDAMISVIAHEVTEAMTDPYGTTWYDAYGNENADKCAWKFGKTYTTANGASANMKIGKRDFLVQQNWIVDQNQCCMTGYSRHQ